MSVLTASPDSRFTLLPRDCTVALLSALMLFGLFASGAFAQSLSDAASTQRRGSVERASFHAASLEGNPLGESADQPVLVYLPPSYRLEPQRRYPVVYLLHGLGMRPSDWEATGPGHPALSEHLDHATKAGAFKEMIVVYANGANRYMGSLYMNSSAEGRWEDAIVSDLVGWIDTHYRTLNQAASRGVVGLSMGGFGALRFGFLHPDIFGAVYALSPAFIGFAADLSEENFTAVATPGARSYEDLQRLVATRRVRENYAALIFICAAAISPAPQEKPLPVEFPFVLRDGKVIRNDLVYAHWQAEMPLTMVDRHLADIRRLRGIGFDVGSSDHFRHIPITTRALDKILSARGVPHFFEEFDGDHTTHTQQRLIEHALPFVSGKLLFSLEKDSK
jgi:S-formylglutathione hydrolase